MVNKFYKVAMYAEKDFYVYFVYKVETFII